MGIKFLKPLRSFDKQALCDKDAKFFSSSLVRETALKRLIVSSIAIWLALPSIAFSATTITMDIDTAICMRDHGNGYITTRAVVVFSTICPP